MSSSIASIVLRRSLRCAFSSSSSPISNLRHYSSAAASPLVPIHQTPTKDSSSISSRFITSTADEKITRADHSLIHALETEIECAETNGPQQEVVLPRDVPFEITDNPGDQSITLDRTIGDEEIQVTVYMNDDGEEAGDEDNEDEDDDDTSDALRPTVSLVVTIDKLSSLYQHNTILEFCCNLNSEELEIERVLVKKSVGSDDGAYQGPEFSDLDKALQKALKRYLVARGIKASLYDFLCEYMTSKEGKEYKGWLKKIKEFIKL